jgi:hypothetical protein
MKNLTFFIAILFFTSCFKQKENTTDCIDENSIATDFICIEIYQPVCGCDTVTYSNICYAEAAGVTSYDEGACYN